MSRGLRMAIGFAVGLILGGVTVTAFAAASDYGRSMRLNAPPSSGARFTGIPIYDWADAPGGWGRMNDINRINIGGRAFDVTGGRLFSPRTLAKGAVSFARFGGPAWIGWMLAGLVWDEVTQTWLKPDSEFPPGYWSNGKSSGPFACSAVDECSAREAGEKLCQSIGQPFDSLQGGTETQKHVYCVNPVSGNPGFAGFINWIAPGPQEYVPATDEDIEDAIYAELVSRGMGSDLARRLIEAGYKPQVDGIEIDGPSSIPGGSTTTTTSGPAGQTTTTTNTTHNITYNTNTTNNTSTVTVTTTNNSTTVAPDGTTTETTEETPPEGGETTPPEDPKPFCELYPTASACQELGKTQDEDLGEESVDVIWQPEGGAAGSCPAPIQISVLGTQHAVQWTPICQVASGIRPIVIGLAWLSAALWLFLMARARA